MNGIIVLDGPDAVGKTTLAKHFVKNYDARYIHLSLHKKMGLYQLAAISRAAKLSEHQLVIIDRHWMSEIIYASVYRGGSELTHEARVAERLLAKFAAIYIICVPQDGDLAVKNHERMAQDRNEMYKADSRISCIVNRYRDLYYGKPNQNDGYNDYISQIIKRGGMRSRADSIVYDFTLDGTNLDLFCNTALVKLEARQKSQLPIILNRFTNLSGHYFAANYLMITSRVASFIPGDDGITSTLNYIDFDESEALWLLHDKENMVIHDNILFILLRTRDFKVLLLDQKVFDTISPSTLEFARETYLIQNSRQLINALKK